MNKAIIILLFLWTATCFSLDSLKIGDPAPRFALKDLSGKTVFLSDYCGKLRSNSIEPHVIVLSFFTTWCIPCQSEIPILDKFYQDFQNENVRMFLIAAGEEQKKISDFVAKKSINLPVLLDNFLTTSKNFKVVNQKGQMKVPQLFIIDRNGFIAYRQIGFQEDIDLRKMLVKKVGSLLN